MSGLSNPEPPKKLAARLMCGLFHVGAADPAAVAAGPVVDRQSAARTGLAISAGFFFTLFALSAAIARAYGDWRTLLIAVFPALLLAVVITTIDQSMIAARAMEYGEELARERGFDNDVKRGFFAGLKRFMDGSLKWAARLTLSGLQAYLVGTVLVLSVMSVDVHQRLEADRRAANAPTVATAAAEVDRDIAASRSAAEAAHADINRAEVRRLALAKLVAASVASLAAERHTRIMEMIRQRDAADTLHYDQKRMGNAELGGEKIDGHGTGKLGDGTARKTAEADANLAGQRRAALDAEIARLQGVVEASPSQPALDAATAELSRLRHASAAADLALEAHVAGRGAAIIAAAQDDLAFRRPRNGLLAQVNALSELNQTQEAFRTITAAKLLLMLVDVAALFIKLAFASPNLADLKRSLSFEVAAAEAIEEAEARRERVIEAREIRLARQTTQSETRDRARHAQDVGTRARARFAEDLGDALQAAE